MKISCNIDQRYPQFVTKGDEGDEGSDPSSPSSPFVTNWGYGFLNRLSALASTTVILGGGLVLIGWFFRFPGLARVHPVLGTMSSHTAFNFILAGTALALRQRQNAGVWKLRSARACAGAVILGSLLTLGSEYGSSAV